MMIKKLITFEDLGFVQWGVLDTEETGVYSAIALEEAFFTPLPEMKACWPWPMPSNRTKRPRP